MSAFYDSLRAVALKLIGEKGREVTLRSRSSGAYDASTGSASATYTDTVMSAVVSNYPMRNIDGTRVQQGDLKIMLVSDVAPHVGDGLLIGGVEHEVLDVRELNPGGTTLTYTMQVRRGG